MAQITITINNREYAVACEDGQESRLIQLARVLDEKAKLLTASSGQVNENMLLALVGLLLADELAEAKKCSPLEASQTSTSVQEENIRNIDCQISEQIKTLCQEINSIASTLIL